MSGKEWKRQGEDRGEAGEGSVQFKGRHRRGQFRSGGGRAGGGLRSLIKPV